MPLLDYFHPPLQLRKSWSSFHASWAVFIAQRLNGSILRKSFESEPQAHHGSQVEIDVATYEDDDEPAPDENHLANGAVATATLTYAPPAPPIAGAVSFADPDLFEIRIHRVIGGWKLVAAIVLVSPANKDRPEHRRSFATKVASYLQQGVSVVTVDIVTNRSANLHDDLVRLLDLPANFAWVPESGLSAIAYRVIREQGTERERLDVWPHPIALGAELPTVPLWLVPGLAVPLELELTYTTTCDSLKVR